MQTRQIVVKGKYYNVIAGNRELAWPSLVSVDLSADKKQEYIANNLKLYRKRLLYKNILLLSVAVLFAQTALYGVNSLRSGLQLLKTPSIIVEYLTYYTVIIIGLLFLAPCAMAKLGSKFAIIVGLSLYLAYTVCNLYVHLSTIIIGRVLMAIGAGVLWTAVGCYITKVASFLNVISGLDKDCIVYILFGYFHVIYHVASIWNSLMTTYILYSDKYEKTNIQNRYNDEICGAFYCPTKELNDTRRHTVTTEVVKVYTFCGVHIILCLLSILVVILCVGKLTWQLNDNSNNPQKREVIEVEEKIIGESSPAKTNCRQLWICSSWYHMTNRQQFCLIPLTVYSGLQEYFYLENFSQNYIACSYGYEAVVVITVINGAVTSLSSIIVTQVVKKTGRIPLFVIGALIDCALLLTMFLWYPNTGWPYDHYIISVVWGIGNAIWQCLLHGFYGVLFMDKSPEAAFANHYLWKNVGFMVLTLCSYFLCNYVIIFTLISVLTIGMVGYFVVEVPLYKDARS